MIKSITITVEEDRAIAIVAGDKPDAIVGITLSKLLETLVWYDQNGYLY